MVKGFPRPANMYSLDGMDNRWFPFQRWDVVVSINGSTPTQGIVFESTQGQTLWFICPNGRIHQQHFPQGISLHDYRLASTEEQAGILNGFKIQIGHIDRIDGWLNVVAFVLVLR